MYDDEQEQGVAEQVEEKKPEEVVAEVEAPAVIELEEIGFAGAESPTAKEGEQETPAIRQIREAHRESERKRKEAERKLAEIEASRVNPTAEALPELGPMPGIEDFDYDAEAHKEAVTAWFGRKQAREAAERRKADEQQDAQKQQQATIDRYKTEADSLPVDRARYKAAETEIDASLSPMQKAVLLQSAMPAKLVYALGNSPERLEKLSKITDPIALAFELGRAETAITSTKPARKAPAPDSPLSVAGTGAGSGLDKLYADAQRTGNYTAYYDAKRAAKPKPKPD